MWRKSSRDCILENCFFQILFYERERLNNRFVLTLGQRKIPRKNSNLNKVTLGEDYSYWVILDTILENFQPTPPLSQH